ncbi:MAG: hypothetical protein JKY03_05445, partial [Aureispira sp.]|nr:hypothetical protein [Aureispira sp.]
GRAYYNYTGNWNPVNAFGRMDVADAISHAVGLGIVGNIIFPSLVDYHADGSFQTSFGKKVLKQQL